MTRLHQAFLAGRVWRWHSNPGLAHTGDRVDGHSARVARIILLLHPNPSPELIRAALIHDDGEHAVGDMRAPLKLERPDIAEALDQIEARAVAAIWGDPAAMLSADERVWLRLADRLDAYMWAKHHGANMGRDGWPDARASLSEMAFALEEVTPGLVGFQLYDAIMETMEAMD